MIVCYYCFFGVCVGGWVLFCGGVVFCGEWLVVGCVGVVGVVVVFFVVGCCGVGWVIFVVGLGNFGFIVFGEGNICGIICIRCLLVIWCIFFGVIGLVLLWFVFYSSSR